MIRAFRSIDAAYVPPVNLSPPMLTGLGAELFDVVRRMDGLDSFAKELRPCIEIPLG